MDIWLIVAFLLIGLLFLAAAALILVLHRHLRQCEAQLRALGRVRKPEDPPS